MAMARVYSLEDLAAYGKGGGSPLDPATMFASGTLGMSKSSSELFLQQLLNMPSVQPADSKSGLQAPVEQPMPGSKGVALDMGVPNRVAGPFKEADFAAMGQGTQIQSGDMSASMSVAWAQHAMAAHGAMGLRLASAFPQGVACGVGPLVAAEPAAPPPAHAIPAKGLSSEQGKTKPPGRGAPLKKAATEPATARSEAVATPESGRSSQTSSATQEGGAQQASGSKRKGGEDDDEGEGQEEELNAEDSKRVKRMLSNRESARRSRRRKQAHLSDLELDVVRLRGENTNLMRRLAELGQHYSIAIGEIQSLKESCQSLSRELRAAYEMRGMAGPGALQESMGAAMLRRGVPLPQASSPQGLLPGPGAVPATTAPFGRNNTLPAGSWEVGGSDASFVKLEPQRSV